MTDLVNNLSVAFSHVPAVQTATLDGSAVDMLGFQAAMYVVNTGAIAGAGDFSVKVQESDLSGSGYADVPAAKLIGAAPPATLLANTVYEQGFRVSKRYARVVLTRASGTSIALGSMIVRGDPLTAPV